MLGFYANDGMRRKSLARMLCLILLMLGTAAPALSFSQALSDAFSGVWSGQTEDGQVRVLTILEDGSGFIQENGQEENVRLEADGSLYTEEGAFLAALTLQDGFLLLRDRDDEVWPLLRNETVLPETVNAASFKNFLGTWISDFALVSGFRIPLQDVSMTYEIWETEDGDGILTLSGTGYEEPIDLPCEVREGVLSLTGAQSAMELHLMLHEDDTLTRDMSYMTVHFYRYAP